MHYHLRLGYEKAVLKTESILREHSITNWSVPIETICRRYGFNIVIEPRSKHPALLDLREKTIYLKPMRAPSRSFYIAHELGHYLLPKYYHEESYNTFAECLLIPHDWLMRDINTASITTLAQWYNVSVPVMKQRIKRIGLRQQLELPF